MAGTLLIKDRLSLVSMNELVINLNDRLHCSFTPEFFSYVSVYLTASMHVENSDIIMIFNFEFYSYYSW